MPLTRSLANFRQLSLIAESPRQKRRPLLKKQFSEDIPDFKDPWFEQGSVLGRKGQGVAAIRPPSVKIAWGVEDDTKSLNEEVVIKKCNTEVKRSGSGKLTRHASLEKDSILNNSKQECLGKPSTVNKENDKTEAKPNLKIFLAHNPQQDGNEEGSKSPQPKYLQPLLNNANNQLKIKKSNGKKALGSPKAVEGNRPHFDTKTNTIVVVPLIEKSPSPRTPPEDTTNNGINVVIRPMTAQSKRERFQKRTNSAFQGSTTKESSSVAFRPPLVRSSSAPSIKPDKSKFVATKRKLKGKKYNHTSKSHNSEAVEWKNAAHSGVEIETMVSLISPSGSEDEAEEDDEVEVRPKSALKGADNNKDDGMVSSREASKGVSLRKTVKSVSFQQSSIHAVRSFSASFPARRASMATALTLGQAVKPKANKAQEKRGTNPSSPDADERVPKRRLVRSSTLEVKHSSSWQKAASQVNEAAKKTISIDIQTKGRGEVDEPEELQDSMRLDLEEKVLVTAVETQKNEAHDLKNDKEKDDHCCETPKEKQCWEMYCRMTEKGINVSYDTILRGMLTPTEYRIRRSTSIAEEMQMMLNPPSEEDDNPAENPV